MARVTVEDCLESMQNRFELVLVASRRARQLARGHEAHLGWENDKPTVMALREIAGGHVDASVLDEIEQAEAINAAEEAARRERDFEAEAEQTGAAAETQAPTDAPAADEAEPSAAQTDASEPEAEAEAVEAPEAAEDSEAADEPEADAPDDDDAEEKGS